MYNHASFVNLPLFQIRRTPTILVADTTASEGKTNKSSNLLFTDAMPPQPAPGIRLHLKLENGQATHSFKIRGIANQVFSFTFLKFFLGKWELGNEIWQGRKYSKIGQVSGSPLKSFAGDPKTSGNENNPGTVSWSSPLMVLPQYISQLRGASSRKEASSWGLSTHHVAGHWGD